MAQTTDEEALRHCSRTILHGIHSVFPPPKILGHLGKDPISLKKLLAGEGLWEVRKEVLGWEAILSELRKVLRMRRGVPLKRMQRLVGKLGHASIGIPAGKYLFVPINRLMAREHKLIFWDRVPEAARALRDLGQLLREAATESTHVKELVPGPPAYKATLDGSDEGAGGVWVPGGRALTPIVWRLRWPQEVVPRLVTPTNPERDITNSDLEMAAESLGWLVLEANVPLYHAHNGHKGACVHHWAIEGEDFCCPVRALGRRVVHIRQHTTTDRAFLCAYWDDIGLGSVTDGDIRFVVKYTAQALRYPDLGKPVERIDTHSPRSGGVCALMLSGHSNVEVMKMGRWAPKSTPFMEYIQQQLSTLTTGMVTAMSRIARFTNIEGAVTRGDPHKQSRR
ncbi:hypothetical protein ACHAWF_008332 [Thalassiosira exigua]